MSNSEFPKGWAVGVADTGAVTAVHYWPGEGWCDGYWICSDGEEDQSFDLADGVPERVQQCARELHRELGRPCPWEATG